MAHHKSAIKRIRRNNSANLRNSAYLSSVRTAVKKFKAAVIQGGTDSAVLNPLFVSAQKFVSKAAQKGLLHKNNASRTVARLAKMLKKAGTGSAGTATVKKAAKKAPAKRKKVAKKVAKTAKKN